MKLIWMIFKEGDKDESALIKCIKLDHAEHDSNQVKDLIYEEFQFNRGMHIRLRNRIGNLIPINQHVPVNTKKDPYSLETFTLLKQNLHSNLLNKVDFYNMFHLKSNSNQTSFRIELLLRLSPRVCLIFIA